MVDLELGIKTDPIEYRYSFEWLFRILAEENVRNVQIGTFFELYQLPDKFFLDLRGLADNHGVTITSLFTAHRELGGFFRDDGAGWIEVARRNFERYIEIAGLLGAKSVGSNPGAVMRDRMGVKAAGLKSYIGNMKELMRYGADHGLEWLTIEPMSCLAEPPTLPDEMRSMMEELDGYHAAFPRQTTRAGFCADIAHGYADAARTIRFDNLQLLEAALPHTCELHLKNTDKLFHSTFGFTAAERERGIVDISRVRDLLLANADVLPVQRLIGYLEIGGPKLGRDYSDGELEEMLRGSLHYLKETFATKASITPCPVAPRPVEISTPEVRVVPSIMCADMCHLETDVRRLEAVRADMIHFDLMDSHFVPNMPLGLTLVEQLRPRTALPFDVHLMVRNNELFIRALARIGVQQIAVHAESATHLDRVLNLIREHGIKAGVALNPATPLTALEYVIESLDYVLLMTVNPGFAGQKLVSGAFRKIADCRAFLDAHDQPVPIMVDGNVSFENIPRMVAAGADILVAGTSSLFCSGASLQENAAKMQEAIAVGLGQRRAQPVEVCK